RLKTVMICRMRDMVPTSLSAMRTDLDSRCAAVDCALPETACSINGLTRYAHQSEADDRQGATASTLVLHLKTCRDRYLAGWAGVELASRAGALPRPASIVRLWNQRTNRIMTTCNSSRTASMNTTWCERSVATIFHWRYFTGTSATRSLLVCTDSLGPV